MRILIVHHEPLAQTALANILSARGDVEHFDSASDAIAALQKLEREPYDVLLLDANMPELSGTELVDQLTQRGVAVPAMVLVTAHDERAIAAFEKDAVDYVREPFSKASIGQALDRASRRAEGELAAKFIAALPHLQQLSHQREPKFAIKADGRILFISPGDVLAVQAEGNYVVLHRESASYLLRESISAMAEKLMPYGFIQIHRSVLVNKSFVEEIRPFPTGEYGLKVKGGKEYTVTRTYKNNLKALAEFWIGTDKFLAG
jgi:two-component system LytT family response regulator